MRKWMNLFEHQYASELDEDGLIDYAYEYAGEDADEIDPEMMRELFSDSSATLREVPLDRLEYNGGCGDEAKVENYGKLTTEAPPIIVRGNHIIDGNHRVKVARAKGQKTILAYVVRWDDEPI